MNDNFYVCNKEEFNVTNNVYCYQLLGPYWKRPRQVQVLLYMEFGCINYDTECPSLFVYEFDIYVVTVECQLLFLWYYEICIYM